MSEHDQYGIGGIADLKPVSAPELPYRPGTPGHPVPGIGLVGCGGISEYHLREYQKAGYPVRAVCDTVEDRARKRRDEFAPEATLHTDYRELLARNDIDVLDVATHPSERVAIIQDALRAGKHVLSQKPFVTDLDTGQQLVDVAREQGRMLCVNQNGRWAPHFSYMRHAVANGLIGDVSSISFTVNWDHGWTADTPFNEIKHLILYDFAIHWFDMTTCFVGNQKPVAVYARCTGTRTQKPDPPMVATVTVEYPDTLVSMAFNGDTRFAPHDRTCITGSRGTLFSSGPDLLNQSVQIATAEGIATPALEGDWFTSGFQGTMAELLCASQDDREPTHSATTTLPGLALCFAAVASAETGEPVIPGAVRNLPDPGNWKPVKTSQ